jgi:hypothetical protein
MKIEQGDVLITSDKKSGIKEFIVSSVNKNFIVIQTREFNDPTSYTLPIKDIVLTISESKK